MTQISPENMEVMWLVLTEIIADTGDKPSPSKIGFMNVTTWADSKEAATAKIQQYLASFGWHLISVENANVIDESAIYGEDVAGMIDRTRSNPDAIILGTFHTYKTN
jgi:hypothetical protein